MNRFINDAVTVIIAILIISAVYYAGTKSQPAQPAEIEYTIEVNSNLLIAARIYYHLENDEIFYLGDNLCYRRNDSIYLIESAGFLLWFHSDYGKPGADSLYSAFLPDSVKRGGR